MKKLLYAIASALVAVACITSCNDDSTTVGSSLIDYNVDIIADSSFTLTGRSITGNRIQARTTIQMLGSVDAEGFGSFRSDFVTQFLSTESMDTTDVTVDNIDSVKLVMRVPLSGYVGDSIMPMGLQVFPLTKQLPTPIYNTFDPEGYYDPDSMIAQTMFTMVSTYKPTSYEQTIPYRTITANLGREFGQRLLDKYFNSPETFATPDAFSEWFPGFYVKSSFGNGRLVQIDSTVVTVYYSVLEHDDDEDTDSLYNYSAAYLAVTPEILTNNNYSYEMSPQLISRADNGENLIVAPLGYDVEIKFPAQAILDRFKKETSNLTVINTLTLSIPVEEIPNDCNIEPPTYLLMVKKSELNSFFATSQLPDNITSFYATYDETNKTYDFDSMRDYIIDIVDKGYVEEGDDEFILCAVTAGFESSASSSSSYYYYYYYGYTTSYTLTSLIPYVGKPTMCKLNLDDAKIKFYYSVQNGRIF